MDFQTLPYLYVTISFLLEICFWGPTHPTFSDDVTNYTLFFWSLPLQSYSLSCYRDWKSLKYRGVYILILLNL